MRGSFLNCGQLGPFLLCFYVMVLSRLSSERVRIRFGATLLGSNCFHTPASREGMRASFLN